MQLFTREIFTFLREHQLFEQADRVLVACSGGVDSIVLLHFLASERHRLGIEVSAVYVDHMLRGEDSALDGVLVNTLCTKLGIPFHGTEVPIPQLLEKHGGNVQTVCREERYAFFDMTMRTYNYNKLAVAHHAEDQVESVLMAMTKGSLPTGIPVQRAFANGAIVRPFLPARKQSLYEYADRYQLAFNEDPSNQSDAYMRNRFRNHIVPYLLQENASTPENVVRMTTQLQEDEAYLQAIAKERLEELVQFTDEGLPMMENTQFITMPTALQRRVVKLLLGYLYDKEKTFISYTSSLIEHIVNHLNSQHGNVSIDLPLSYQFVREYDKLTLVKEHRNIDFSASEVLPIDTKVTWKNGVTMYWTSVHSVTERQVERASEVRYFSLSEESLPLMIRHREKGDRMALTGMSGTKKLSRLFIDEKVGKANRNCLPIVLTNDGTVCAVPTLRYGQQFTKTATPTTKYIFIVE